jgi:hypothetical protein
MYQHLKITAEGTRGQILVDGQDVSHGVREVSLKWGAGRIPVATMSVLAKSAEFEGTVDVQVAGSGGYALPAEDMARHVTELMQDAASWRALMRLTGNWQDGSGRMVKLDQDDATQSCLLMVNAATYAAADFAQAVAEAVDGEGL